MALDLRASQAKPFRHTVEQHLDEENAAYDAEQKATAKRKRRTAGKLTAEQRKDKHKRLWEWYVQEREKQAANRYQMAIDCDFYDNIQWSDEDSAEVEGRGQWPLVFNVTAPTIDWLLGTEKRTRVDSVVLPREEDDEANAIVKGKMMKWLDGINQTSYYRSLAFGDTVKAGLGWVEDGVRGDITDEPIYSRHESWRNVIHDSSSVERDGKDMRYLFRVRWTDEDIALVMFPDFESEIKQAAVAAGLWGNELDEDFWYLGQHFQSRDAQGEVVGRRTFVSDAFSVDNRRRRVKLIEAWYRMPEPCKICHGDDYHGQRYDDGDKDMVQAVQEGRVTLYDAIQMRVRVAIMTEGHLLVDSLSPYKHDRFGLTPIYCYRRNRDNMPYGAIRRIRDPQEDLNKRASKALFILSTNRVKADADALQGTDQTWDDIREEAARPDSLIVHKKGSTIEIDRDVQLAEEHLMLMDRDAVMIQKVAGVTDDNLGRRTNAISGEAIRARQDQGSVVTAEIFDNLRFATQVQGQIRLSLAEQYISLPKVVRITGERGQFEWARINQPEQQPDGTVRYVNDITARSADYIVDEQSYSRSWREAMFNTLMDLLGKIAQVAPQAALQLLDIAFEFSDVPGKAEFVGRIRKIIGYIPEDLSKLTPEERKKVEDQLQQQAAAGQLQAQAADLEMKEKQANIAKIAAQAEQALATAEKAHAEAAALAQQSNDLMQQLLAGFQELQQAVVAAIPAPQ